MSKQRKPFISMLEPRILFDGAALTTAVDTLDATSFDNSDDTSTQELPATQSPSENRKEVVFIDPAVDDKQTLIDGIDDGVDVYILDGENDALAEIADILKTYDNVDALHIISHGSTGELNFASGTVDGNSLEEFSDELQAIGEALSEDADILLYGCNVASNGDGEEFINEIAKLSGADVAASDDITGVSGDWDLEYNSDFGNIETDELEFYDYDFDLPWGGAGNIQVNLYFNSIVGNAQNTQGIQFYQEAFNWNGSNYPTEQSGSTFGYAVNIAAYRDTWAGSYVFQDGRTYTIVTFSDNNSGASFTRGVWNYFTFYTGQYQISDTRAWSLSASDFSSFTSSNGSYSFTIKFDTQYAASANGASLNTLYATNKF